MEFQSGRYFFPQVCSISPSCLVHLDFESKVKKVITHTMNHRPWNIKGRIGQSQNSNIHCFRHFTVMLSFALEIIGIQLFIPWTSKVQKKNALALKKSQIQKDNIHIQMLNKYQTYIQSVSNFKQMVQLQLHNYATNQNMHIGNI